MKALGFSVSLYALCSRSQSNLDKACKRLDKEKRAVIKTFNDLDAVLADPLVDVVDLVLPIPAMPAAIEKCLLAGKSVISEKPIAPSPDDCGRLWACYQTSGDADEGRQGGCCWCVLENWATKPAVLHVHRLLQSRAIGDIKHYHLQLRLGVPKLEQQGWRAGIETDGAGAGNYEGGWSLDVGVHAVRALRMWFGPVVSVDGKSSTHLSEAKEKVHIDDPSDHAAAVLGGNWTQATEGWIQHENALRGYVRFHFFEEAPRNSVAKHKNDREKEGNIAPGSHERGNASDSRESNNKTDLADSAQADSRSQRARESPLGSAMAEEGSFVKELYKNRALSELSVRAGDDSAGALCCSELQSVAGGSTGDTHDQDTDEKSQLKVKHGVSIVGTRGRLLKRFTSIRKSHTSTSKSHISTSKSHIYTQKIPISMSKSHIST